MTAFPRLSKAKFEVVFNEGKRANGKCSRAIANPGEGRVGIATNRKIGCIARRNRQKRRVREALRLQPAIVPNSLDIVIVVQPTAEQASFTELRREVIGLVQRVSERWANESAST